MAKDLSIANPSAVFTPLPPSRYLLINREIELLALSECPGVFETENLDLK